MTLRQSCDLFRANCALMCALLLLIATGCGPESMEQPTYPVSGEVKLDGQPLKNATIVFHAVDKTKFKWQELPQALTDEQGKFSIHTYSSNDGAPAADYKVGITTYEAQVEEGSDQVSHDKSKPRLPAKYADPETSGLTAKVEAKSTQLPVFDLKSQ